MNSLNSLLLLLLVLPVLLAVDFSCGSGKKQNAIALKYVNRHCPKGRGSYDVCCKIHDECYSKKVDKALSPQEIFNYRKVSLDVTAVSVRVSRQPPKESGVR